MSGVSAKMVTERNMAEVKALAEVFVPQQTEDPEKHTEDPESELTVGTTEDEYLHGLPLTLMTLALMAGVFMIALDNAIICTALLRNPPNASPSSKQRLTPSRSNGNPKDNKPV